MVSSFSFSPQSRVKNTFIYGEKLHLMEDMRMEFIRTFFNVKLGAVEHLFGLIKSAWDERVWLAVVLMVLWTVFCIIGGTLLLPIDFIYSAIMWCKHEEFREFMEMAENAMTQEQE